MATWKKLKLQNVIWISLLIFCLLSVSTAWAQEDSVDYWPQEIEIPQGVVVIYQPQPEKLEGNKLSGLAAVAVEMKSPSSVPSGLKRGWILTAMRESPPLQMLR